MTAPRNSAIPVDPDTHLLIKYVAIQHRMSMKALTRRMFEVFLDQHCTPPLRDRVETLRNNTRASDASTKGMTTIADQLAAAILACGD